MTKNKQSKAVSENVSIPIQLLLTSLPGMILLILAIGGNNVFQFFPSDMFQIILAIPVLTSVIYISVYHRIQKTGYGIAIIVAASLTLVSGFTLYAFFLVLLPIIFALAVIGIAYFSRKWNKKIQKYGKT